MALAQPSCGHTTIERLRLDRAHHPSIAQIICLPVERRATGFGVRADRVADQHHTRVVGIPQARRLRRWQQRRDGPLHRWCTS